MDHNMCTLSGKGSLRAMGMICSTAPPPKKKSYTQFKISPLTAKNIAKVYNAINNKDTKIKEYITLETASRLSRFKFKGIFSSKKEICDNVYYY